MRNKDIEKLIGTKVKHKGSFYTILGTDVNSKGMNVVVCYNERKQKNENISFWNFDFLANAADACRVERPDGLASILSRLSEREDKIQALKAQIADVEKEYAGDKKAYDNFVLDFLRKDPNIIHEEIRSSQEEIKNWSWIGHRCQSPFNPFKYCIEVNNQYNFDFCIYCGEPGDRG